MIDDLTLLARLLGETEGVEALWFRFQRLGAIVTASDEELASLDEVSAVARDRVRALRELLLRLERPDVPAPEIDGSEAAYAEVAHLEREPQEVVAGLFLDARNRRIAVREIFRGGVDMAHARPREILVAALRANAARLIVAHNHPSQDPSPSEADVRFTALLREAARTVGMPLLDHVVVGGGRYYSFADRRWR